MVSQSSNIEAFYFLAVFFNLETQDIETNFLLTFVLCMHDGIFWLFFCILLIYSILRISDCIALYLQVCYTSKNVCLPSTSPFSSLLTLSFLFGTPVMKQSSLGFLFSFHLAKTRFYGRNRIQISGFFKIIYRSLAICTFN